jgi:hypothetical protein
MTFGVLFDFTGNSNVSKVIKAADLVKEQWFIDAVNYDKPVDLFLVIGHNPVRTDSPSFTVKFVSKTIRALRPQIPVQVFGGHTHIRDFKVYDDMSTALESGELSIWILHRKEAHSEGIMYKFLTIIQEDTAKL